MSLAGEASSSQALGGSSPPPSPQVGRGVSGAHRAPPTTLFKQRVRWSWASFAGGRGGSGVKLFSWEDNDTTRVKGDDDEAAPESEQQTIARVDEQANQTGLQEDLLRSVNDVVREQVGAASDSFMEASR